jgi:hypothetical protein
MRFFFTGAAPTLAELDAGFRQLDAKYTLRPETGSAVLADLLYGDDLYATVEINAQGGTLYTEDVEELREQLNDPAAPPEDYAMRQYVIGLLDRASGMIAVHVSDFGNVYYDRIDPFWDWLFETRDGFLQVDDEGYYDRDGVLLSLS